MALSRPPFIIALSGFTVLKKGLQIPGFSRFWDSSRNPPLIWSPFLASTNRPQPMRKHCYPTPTDSSLYPPRTITTITVVGNRQSLKYVTVKPTHGRVAAPNNPAPGHSPLRGAFVGRQREMEELKAALDDARGGWPCWWGSQVSARRALPRS